MKRYRDLFLLALLGISSFITGCATSEQETGQIPATEAAPITENSIYQLASEWTDQRGQKVTLQQLAGRPRVATMFYSSCDFACPKTIEDMKQIRNGLPEELRDRIEMTLFSFDPARDTPARLDTIASDMELKENWLLLTSTDEAAEELGAVTEIQYKDLETGEFSHSNTILILNASGEIIHRQEGVNSDPAKSIEVLTQLLR